MRNVKAFLLAFAAVTLLVFGTGAAVVAAPANADRPALDYDVYLKLDGVCGESKAERFQNWIKLTGVDFGVTSTHAAPATAQGSGRSAGKAEMQPLTVTKPYDCSSISLMQNALSGKHMKDGQIAFVTRGAERPATVLTIELTDVVISGYQFDNMTESVSFSAGSLNLRYAATDPKGGGGKTGTVQGGWDFTTGKAK